jgi:hypothetical protein
MREWDSRTRALQLGTRLDLSEQLAHRGVLGVVANGESRLQPPSTIRGAGRARSRRIWEEFCSLSSPCDSVLSTRSAGPP